MGASGVDANFVEGTVEVSQPVGDDGVRVTEDVAPSEIGRASCRERV